MVGRSGPLRRGAPGRCALPSTLAPLLFFPLTPRVSDRLNELQRQRALAQEQIAWLDREIARERGESVLPAATMPAAVASATPTVTEKPAAAVSAAEVDIQAAEILERFKKTEPPIRDNVRRGCFLYFIGAFALLALGVVTFYLLHRQPE